MAAAALGWFVSTEYPRDSRGVAATRSRNIRAAKGLARLRQELFDVDVARGAASELDQGPIRDGRVLSHKERRTVAGKLGRAPPGLERRLRRGRHSGKGRQKS